MTAQTIETPSVEDLCANVGIVVEPLTEWIGADIRGADLSKPVTDQIFEAIHGAWLRHQVLRFRGQDLCDSDLVRFSGMFGELDSYTHPNPLEQDPYPEIFIVSNITKDGQPIGQLGNYDVWWHTDMSYTEIPPKMSTIYALEAPSDGGETGFLNMYNAYETLDDGLRQKIDGARLKQDDGHAADGLLRPGLDPEAYADVTTAPGAVHPIVRTHPETQRKCLYLGKRHRAYIEDIDLDESNAVLDALWSHTIHEELAWFNIWQPGDFLMWDNRCTMHKRREFDDSARRILHRTQIKDKQPPS